MSKVKILNDIFAKILPRMKKVMMALLAAVVVVAAVAGTASCEKYVLPALTLGQDTIAVNCKAQEAKLVIDSNVQWDFKVNEIKAEWLSFDPEWAELGLTATISIEENTTGAQRSVTVPVESQTIARKLFIVQSADEKVPVF